MTVVRWMIVPVIIVALSPVPSWSQNTGPHAAENAQSRPGVSAGMGVSYVSATDIVDLVNATPGAVERLSQFKAAVEFFGAVSVPLSAEWVLKLEYSYMLGSYNIETQIKTAEYTLVVHMPTLFLQYILVERGVYNVKVGAGAGYHVGALEENYLINDRFSASGPGLALDLEANTAFGEHVYVYLGGNLRWEFMGDLTASGGASPGGAGFQPALHLFGAGARLGFTYYF